VKKMVFENISKILNKVSKEVGLSEAELSVLTSFKRIKKVELTLNGEKYLAWRIVHTDALGPGKGGIRFHPNVSEDEVKSLAFWMSIKNSLAGLPYGGAKGGIRINPKNMSKEDLEKVSREYIRAFHGVVGENIDVPAPDVYTTPEIMGWMLDEYEKIKGEHEPGMITGKPLSLQGCKFRATSTSKGGYIIFKEFLSKINKKDVTIAVQGFGNAGYNFAQMAYDDGFKVVAVSDSKGGIFDSNGLNITEVKKVKDETRSVVNYDASKVSNEEIIEMDVDFLVLAALENQVTSENVEKVKAPYIIELANGPVSSEADDVLFKKGISVIPDILANSGGVIGSYFEWVQNKTGNIFEESYLEERFEKLMSKNLQKVYELHKEKNIDMRTAAYIIAIKRILDAERARGRL